MKPTILFFILCCFQISNAFTQDNKGKPDSVSVIQEYRNLYLYRNFYLSGQPTYEELLWLKSEGVTKIINLRSERENTEFAASAFNEEKVIPDMGMAYYALPVDGIKDYTPEKLVELTRLLNTGEKILIHCAGAGRVTDFFMAYLVNGLGYSLDDAVKVGKQLRFSLPLEKLLQKEISLETVN